AGASPRSGRGLSLLGLESTLQHLHQVDDLGLVLRLLGLRRLLDIDAARELVVDQRSQTLDALVPQQRAIHVVGRERADGTAKALDVGRGGLGLERQPDVLGAANLLAEAQRLRTQDTVLGKQRDEVLLAAHHERRDACSAAALHCLGEQPIRPVRLVLGGSQEVRSLEVHRVDLRDVDKLPEVDRARLLRRERLELLVRDDDELAVVELVAADDLVPRKETVVLRAHVSASQRPERAIDELQRQRLGSYGRKKIDRQTQETERDRARPQRPRATAVELL